MFIDGTAQLVPNYTLEDVLFENFRSLPHPSLNEAEARLATEIKKTCPVTAEPGIGPAYDPQVAEWVREKSDEGRRVFNDFLIPQVHTNGFVPGSTDVGDVSWQTPTAQIHVASFVSGAPGHSWQNVSAGGSSIGHKALLHAGKVLACTALDLYADRTLLEKAETEFRERTKEGYVCPIEPGAVPIVI